MTIDADRVETSGLRSLDFGLPRWWSMASTLRRLGDPGPARVFGLWLASVALSIATGLAVVYLDMTALPIPLGVVTVEVTVYPPILIGMLQLLWLGPGWAISSTYLATFVLGAYSGLPIGSCAIFSLADPILILIVCRGLAVLDLPLTTRSWSTWVYFLVLVLLGSVASSLGALVWNYSHDLSFAQGLQVWEGWIVGAFLHAGPLVIPIQLLAGAKVRDWLESKLDPPHRPRLGLRFIVSLFGMAAILVAAVAAMVGKLLANSLAEAIDPAEMLLNRMPEIALFVGLFFASTLGTAVLLSVGLTRRSEREQARASTDSLTGCRNRTSFSEIYQREADRSLRLRHSLAILFLDIDHFKRVNDQHGYAIGDQVLCEVAGRIALTIRQTDYLLRWGGEEFLLLLPHTTAAEAESLAERIRTAVSAEPVAARRHCVSVTVSLGVAASLDPERSSDQLVEQAADACRLAKNKGRDVVVMAGLRLHEQEMTKVAAPHWV